MRVLFYLSYNLIAPVLSGLLEVIIEKGNFNPPGYGSEMGLIHPQKSFIRSIYYG